MSDLDAAAVKKLKVAELRSELTKRGLDVKGNKPVLVERLLEALENASQAVDEEVHEEIKEPETEDGDNKETAEAPLSPDVPKQDGVVEESATEETLNDSAADTNADAEPTVETVEKESAETAEEEIASQDKPEPMETNAEPAKVEEEKSEEPKKAEETEGSTETSRVEPEEEEVELDDSLVVLDKYNCDLHLKVSPEGLSCKPIPDEGFSYLFAGARATWGVTAGKVCFECKVSALINAELPESEEPKQVVRVGWSTDSCNLMLGEDELSYGYDNTSKKCNKSEFTEFGQTFGEGDVITCYLDLDSETKTVAFCKNGEDLGVAFELSGDLAGKALFPHVLVKNAECSLNFGSPDEPWFAIKEEYAFIQQSPEESRIHGTRGPSDKKECEVIMMIGLPASGKTTWVNKHVEENPDKKYNVLGTNSLLEKMKIMGSARKRDAVGYNKLMDKVAKCLHRLFEIAPTKKRHYILDQTNVYYSAQKKKLRPFEAFHKKAIVCVPTPEEMKRRNEERKKNGIELPDNAISDMKLSFTLPKEGEFTSIEYADQGEDVTKKIVEDYLREGRAYRSRSGSGSEPSYKRPRYDDRPRHGGYAPRDRYYDDRRGGYDSRRGSYGGGRSYYGGRGGGGFRGGYRGRGGSGGYQDRREYGGYRGGGGYHGSSGGGYRQNNYQPRQHQSNYNQHSQRSYQQPASHSYSSQGQYAGSGGYGSSYSHSSSYYQPQQQSYYSQQSYSQQGYGQQQQQSQQTQQYYGRYSSSSGYSGSTY